MLVSYLVGSVLTSTVLHEATDTAEDIVAAAGLKYYSGNC